MQTLRIGIYLHPNPGLLEKTMESLRSWSDRADIVALSDAQGAAACFNHLISPGPLSANKADVLLFVESGAVFAPEAIERMLAAVQTPGAGLAGPSTNRCWNEQGSHPAAHAVPEGCRPLTPLHSLSDFCYMVRREVVEAIGLADEGYGRGPCWEMDYNIRAARAGFQGVWACSAYVYRPPAQEWRIREERAAFAANKARYQDKFCGRRLRGARDAYKNHCMGDACANFAPLDLISLRIAGPPAASQSTAPPQHVSVEEGGLVSCVMVTRGRPAFVRQSIRYFQQQDYPARELIILDDDLGQAEPEPDPRIRYIRVSAGASIGAKRNQGCELARGSYVVHWDDDDWYGPGRLSAQLGPLLSGHSDITGLISDLFFDLEKWEFWRCSPALHRRMFVEDVHGGTLAYRRSLWGPRCRYPDISVAEDAQFLRAAVRSGAKLRRIPGAGLFVYLRHGANSWKFECGKYPGVSGWTNAEQPAFTAQEVEFYRALTRKGADTVAAPDSPLVSCIMPTFNRRALVPQAIQYFLRQDYANRELIIVDDGEDAVGDLVPRNANIRYERLPARRTVGAKRNLACEMARGALIAHWDDDDWMADWRLSYQVQALQNASGKSVCGLAGIHYYAPHGKRSWFYQYPASAPKWVAGNTLFYDRNLWRATPFGNLNEGEDTRFVWSQVPGAIHVLDRPDFYVGMVHDRNVSPKRTGDPRWLPRPVEQIRSIIGTDFAFYETWPKVPAARTRAVTA